MKKKFGLIFLVLFSILQFSCVLQYDPPFILNKPDCIIGKREGLFDFVGVLTKFYNTSNKDIRSLEVSFDVFDRKTEKSPFVNSNHITSNFNSTIASGQGIELCVSLDSYVFTIPEEKYVIQNYCVRYILFADGTRWNDPFCSYSVNSD